MSTDDGIRDSARKPPRLIEQVSDAIRRKHYSPRTEDSDVHWIKRFIYFHGKRHPLQIGEAEVTAFLNHLVRVRMLHERDIAAGYGDVELSDALARKYPRAPYEWGWKFVFPSHKLSAGPRSAYAA